MSLLTDLLALPFDIANIPNRTIELLVDPDSKKGDEDNLLSKPLDIISKAIKELDE